MLLNLQAKIHRKSANPNLTFVIKHPLSCLRGCDGVRGGPDFRVGEGYLNRNTSTM